MRFARGECDRQWHALAGQMLLADNLGERLRAKLFRERRGGSVCARSRTGIFVRRRKIGKEIVHKLACKNGKVKHWSAFSGAFVRNAAPVLGFGILRKAPASTAPHELSPL